MKAVIATNVARCYYNRAGNREKIWSVDLGPGTTEMLCGGVTIANVSGSVSSDPNHSDPDLPKVWISFENVIVTIDFEKNRIWIRAVS